MRKPIPPKTVVRLAAKAKSTRRWNSRVGEIFRIGYYGRRDGLDCIWLVNEAGEYEQTVDHAFLLRHFDIIQLSDERSFYGKHKPPIGPVVFAGSRTQKKTPRRHWEVPSLESLPQYCPTTNPCVSIRPLEIWTRE
jgi:hypothetical protein